MKIWHYLLIACGVALIGLASFIAIANRSLRQDNKTLKSDIQNLEQANKNKQVSIDSLYARIRNRDEIDSVRAIKEDSLVQKLKWLNGKNIVTIHSTYSEVTALDLDGDIKFLNQFLK